MLPFSPALDDFTVERAPRWVPRIKSGYFWIEDRRYYLYARKATAFLRDLTWTRFTLADAMVPGTEEVFINGHQIPKENYRLVGAILEVRHSDPLTYVADWGALEWDFTRWGFYTSGVVVAPDDSVRVTGEIRVWGGTAFTRPTMEQTVFFRDGEQFYRFVEIPKDRAPVVITDDFVEDWDARNLSYEFAVDYNSGEFRINCAENLFANPTFDTLILSGQLISFDDPSFPFDDPGSAFNTLLAQGLWFPTYWDVNVVNPAEAGVERAQGAVGKTRLFLTNGKKATQRVPIRAGTHTISFYMAGETTDPIQAKVTVTYLRDNLDTSYTTLGSDTKTFNVTPEIGKWTRQQLTISSDPNIADLEGRVEGTIPAGTTHLEVAFENPFAVPANPKLLLDAVQLERAYLASDFCHIGPFTTVEYETGTGFHNFHSLAAYDRDGVLIRNDFPLEQLDGNPLNASKHSGFLMVYEGDGVADFQLGIGNTEFQAAVGEFLDARGFNIFGATFTKQLGRRHLPYAKVDGKGKFRQRQSFHINNQPPTVEVTEVGSPPSPRTLDLIVPHRTIRASAATAGAFVPPETPGIPILTMNRGDRIKLVAQLVDEFDNGMDGQLLTWSFDGIALGSFLDTALLTNADGLSRIIYEVGPVTGLSKIRVEFGSILSDSILLEVR